MIKTSWLMARIGAAAAAEPQVSSALASAIALFERETGVIFAARSQHAIRFTVPRGRESSGLWIPATNVSNLSVRESSESFKNAESEDAIDSDEIDEQQFATAARITRIGGSWAPFVVASFDCGHADLPASMADIRDAIAQQVEYDMARNRGENVAVVSRFGKDTAGATYRDSAFAPAFDRAARAWRLVLP